MVPPAYYHLHWYVLEAKQSLSALKHHMGLERMPFSSFHLHAALNWTMKLYTRKSSKGNAKPFNLEQILAMLGFLVKGDYFELTKLHLASIIVLCWFASISFEEMKDLAFDSMVIQPSSGLLFHFPTRKGGTQMVGRAVEFRTGHFMGCQIDPVDILKRYLWHISALPLGPPSFLFTQFIGRVHPDGHWYQVVGKDNGDPIHPTSIIQVWQTSRRNLVSSSYLSGDGPMVYWSARLAFPKLVPAEVITPDQFIRYVGLDELLIRADHVANEEDQMGLHREGPLSEPHCQEGLVEGSSITEEC